MCGFIQQIHDTPKHPLLNVIILLKLSAFENEFNIFLDCTCDCMPLFLQKLPLILGRVDKK